MIAKSIIALLMVINLSATASGETAVVTLQEAYDAALVSYEE
jgi:hypothetical protein